MSRSLTVIVLNWNNATDTLACLESLARQEYPHRVLVVDNGSTDDSVARIRAAFPTVEILETGENLGYAGGNNVGIRYALAQGAEYLLILNNDVVLAPDCLSRLMETIRAHPNIEIASPLIADMADGKTIWALGQYVDHRTGAVYRYAAGETVEKWYHSEPFQMTAISGTAWLASRKALETVGLLDDQFFLYYEETDWSLQASKAGYALWIVPNAILWHKVSATLGTTSPIVDYYMTRNYFRFIARHWRGLRRAVLLGAAVWRQLATISAYTLKPHDGQRIPHRNARLLALRDVVLRRWGKKNLALSRRLNQRVISLRSLLYVRRRRKAQALEKCEQACVSWLEFAQMQGLEGGVPAFYDVIHNAWAPDYPETTAYLIPTCLRGAQWYPQLREMALRMADFVLRCQKPSGGVPSWGDDSQVFVFDTAQALQGWLCAWEVTRDKRYLQAAIKAGDWLVFQQEPEGYWRKFHFGRHIKAWDARVAWPLIQAGKRLERQDYTVAGQRCLDWVLTLQHPDGWFDHCTLEPNEPAVLHVIAYTIEGLLESGMALNEPDYIQAAQRAADALLNRQHPDGRLCSYWLPGWIPCETSSCLTGDAQMAYCWLRLYEVTQEKTYFEAAQRILTFVASTQIPNSKWLPIRGAIAGSWPIWGRYLPWRYPNWACKFLLDSLFLLRALQAASKCSKGNGEYETCC